MYHRPIHSDDAPLLARIYADPRAMRWLSADGLPLSDAAIAQIVATNVTRWQTLGYGTWLFLMKTTYLSATQGSNRPLLVEPTALNCCMA